MTDRYNELRVAAEAATLGPWQNGIGDLEGVVAPKNLGLGNVICIPPSECMYSSLERWPDNAAFIALANPATILTILDALSHETERADLLQAAVLERTAERDAALARVGVLEGAIDRIAHPPYGIGFNGLRKIARSALSPAPTVKGEV